MRKLLAVCAIFSSVLLHAQSVAKGSSIKLEALNGNATLVSGHGASQPATDVTTPQPIRVSTGVIGPKLIKEPSLTLSLQDFQGRQVGSQHMVVSFRVDENGIPQNVHLVQTVNPAIDGRILEAVRQYRFEPATLDNNKVAVEINMHVNFAAR